MRRARLEGRSGIEVCRGIRPKPDGARRPGEVFCWEDLRQYDQNTTDLKRLSAFIESYQSALSSTPEKEDDGRRDKEAKEKGKEIKKWSKPWAKDGDKTEPKAPTTPAATAAPDSQRGEATKKPDTKHETNVRMHAAGVATCGQPDYRPVTWVQVRADRRRSKWVTLRCLVDEGCEVSFISTDAARKLGFGPAEGSVALTLSYFGGRTQRSSGAPRAIKLRGLGDAGPAYPAVVCELEQLRETLAGVKLPAAGRHLQEALPHVPTEDGPLEMILGYDLKGLMLPTRVLAGGRDEPTAVATKVA